MELPLWASFQAVKILSSWDYQIASASDNKTQWNILLQDRHREVGPLILRSDPSAALFLTAILSKHWSENKSKDKKIPHPDRRLCGHFKMNETRPLKCIRTGLQWCGFQRLLDSTVLLASETYAKCNQFGPSRSRTLIRSLQLRVLWFIVWRSFYRCYKETNKRL